MTMGFIQRANETAEYLAANERNSLEPSSEENPSAAAATSDANQPSAAAGAGMIHPLQAHSLLKNSNCYVIFFFLNILVS